MKERVFIPEFYTGVAKKVRALNVTMAVQHLVGHASPVTTSKFDHRDEKTKREAATKIHFPMGGS